MQIDAFKEGRWIYLNPPVRDPQRLQVIKYSTWRMRLYQQLQAISPQQLAKKSIDSIDKIFPKLILTAEQKQFFQDFTLQRSSTNQQQTISHFVCRMLYSRDIKNQQVFIRMERMILSLRLKRLKNTTYSMDCLKKLVQGLISIPVQQLQVSKNEYEQNATRINKWFQGNKNYNQNNYLKIPFELAQYGIKKRRCFIQKGYVYADFQTVIQIVLNLYTTYLKQKLIKARSHTQKFLLEDLENQLKPFMDKAINCINSATIQQSQLSTEFKLNLKNIDGVSKRFFPPCMHHLNKKLKQNNHLKHDGRRQLWLFFKACGMDVNDNKQYFSKYLGLKVSNSDMKSHLYNIQHAYGLVGKKQPQRAKMCRGIITGPQPKRDQHHGCPFRHWGTDHLKQFLLNNYSLNDLQLKQILSKKQQNAFQVACGRLFEANFKPEVQNLPQQITKQLGRSPQQYFIAGMAATQWINTKTLRPMKYQPTENKKNQNNKMQIELQF